MNPFKDRMERKLEATFKTKHNKDSLKNPHRYLDGGWDNLPPEASKETLIDVPAVVVDDDYDDGADVGGGSALPSTDDAIINDNEII